MSELTFVDELPEVQGGSAKTRERAAQIKANPGRWAQWPSTTPSSAVQKALNKIGDGFEVVSRKCPDGKTYAFVRYAPQEEPAARPNGNGHGSVTQLPAARVKCPTCAQFISVAPGETNPLALGRHESTNAVCKAANKRNRNVAR